ncbi:uncharacterized protein YjgD (DUF1641 family) [Silvibacterium bohemicum]|uniref:Uncharacterized protein YjgD (DUF1641 family) n=1 Tax=Silvibacterium bohemicum TaxID=1577686 RepID=A0A841JSR4_9BACT|nr:DUF1641 domain-containing protein [Silvibacterium bohemicum]MBB6144443.1 uncharacterized protein YjgD (DUF1641 family) [Silvibacterium bohemicum]
MAKAVEFRHFKPANSREDLVRRIEDSPQTHADAVLEAFDLLDNLHKKGLLSALNGALGASETLINQAVDIVSSKEAVSATRIALMLGGLLSSVDANQVSAALKGSEEEKPPSLLAIARLATSKDVRRGMATGLALLAVFGSALAGQKKPDQKD